MICLLHSHVDSDVVIEKLLYFSTRKSANIKKVGLDPTDLKSDRPTSNLSVVPKSLERLVAMQLIVYLKDNG